MKTNLILTMLIFTAIDCYAEGDVGYRVAYASPPPSRRGRQPLSRNRSPDLHNYARIP